MMKIVVNKSDILSLICDFFNQQNLCLTANSLQKETGVLSDNFHDAVQPLKDHIFNGRLVEARKFLQSFVALFVDSSQTKRLLQLLFRQQFCEHAFGGNTADLKNALNDFNEEIESLCSGEEYINMINDVKVFVETLFERDMGAVSLLETTRAQTFLDIFALISPFLPDNGVYLHDQNNRLISLLTKGLLYEHCMDYCHRRATGRDTSEGNEVNFTSKERSQSTGPNAFLYYWLTSIVNDEVFRKEFNHHDLQINYDLAQTAATRSDETDPKRRSFLAVGKESDFETHQHSSLFCGAATYDDRQPVEPDTRTPTVVETNLPNATTPQKPPTTRRNASPRRLAKEQLRLSTNKEAAKVKTSHEASLNPDVHKQEVPTAPSAAVEPASRVVQQTSQRESIMDAEELNNSMPNTSVRDSYSNYIAEQCAAREHYNKFMEEMQRKEEENQVMRKNLIEGAAVLQPTKIGITKQSTDSDHPPLLDLSAVDNIDHTASIADRSLPAGSSPLSASPQRRRQEDKTRTPAADPTQSSAKTSVHASGGKLTSELPFSYHPLEKTEDVAAIRAVAFHPNERCFAVGSNSHVLKLCSVPNRALVPQPREVKTQSPDWMQIIMKKSQVHQGSIYAMAWNERGNILATCSNDKLIKIFNYDQETSILHGPQHHLKHHDGVIRDVTFLTGGNNGSMLASGGASDFVVYTYACEVDTVVHQMTGHSDQVLSLYAWGNGMLASSSQDRSVRFWDLRMSRCVRVMGVGSPGDLHNIPTSVCTDVTGRYFAIGRDDHVISLHDLRGDRIISEFKVHENEVRSVRFNPTLDNLLLSSSYDGTAVVTDINALTADHARDLSRHSVRCVCHSDKVIQCRWHPSGMAFATTSADQTCLLWGSREL